MPRCFPHCNFRKGNLSLATCWHFNNNIKPVVVQLDLLCGVRILVEPILCHKCCTRCQGYSDEAKKAWLLRKARSSWGDWCLNNNNKRPLYDNILSTVMGWAQDRTPTSIQWLRGVLNLVTAKVESWLMGRYRPGKNVGEGISGRGNGLSRKLITVWRVLGN